MANNGGVQSGDDLSLNDTREVLGNALFLIFNDLEEGLGNAMGICRCFPLGGMANAWRRNRAEEAGATGGTDSKSGRGSEAAAFFQP